MDLKFVDTNFRSKVSSVSLNSHWEIKLLEHAFMLYVKLLDGRLDKLMNIDNISYKFMPWSELLIL